MFKYIFTIFLLFLIGCSPIKRDLSVKKDFSDKGFNFVEAVSYRDYDLYEVFAKINISLLDADLLVKNLDLSLNVAKDNMLFIRPLPKFLRENDPKWNIDPLITQITSGRLHSKMYGDYGFASLYFGENDEIFLYLKGRRLDVNQFLLEFK